MVLTAVCCCRLVITIHYLQLCMNFFQHSAGPQQPQQAPAAVPGGGGPAAPDYSAQWADYYRSIGKLKEAEQIEAQIRAKNGGGGGAPPAAPGQPQPYVSQQQYYQPQQVRERLFQNVKKY